MPLTIEYTVQTNMSLCVMCTGWQKSIQCTKSNFSSNQGMACWKIDLSENSIKLSPFYFNYHTLTKNLVSEYKNSLKWYKCNLMSMYIYSKLKIYFSECRFILTFTVADHRYTFWVCKSWYDQLWKPIYR